MKFLMVAHFYSDLIQYFKKKYQDDLKENNFAEHLQLFFDEKFGFSDYFGKYLKKFCGFDSDFYVANYPELMQKSELLKTHSQLNSLQSLDLFLAATKPNIVFIQNSTQLPLEWIQSVKSRYPSIKVIFTWMCSPYSPKHVRIFKEFDFILTCNQKFLSDFRQCGLNVKLFSFGTDRFLIEQFPAKFKTTGDVVFAGSVVQGINFHEGRLEFLFQLCQRFPLLLHSKPSSKFKLFLKKSIGISATYFEKFYSEDFFLSGKKNWASISVNNPKYQFLKKKFLPELFGLDLYKKINQSAVGLNFHIDAAGPYACNARMFEVAGCGSVLLTDWKKNISDLFLEDQEVVTYKSTEECIEKLDYLLNNPNKMLEIATLGQKRCLRDHLFEDRVRLLGKELQELLN